jgi:hypothetical protein
MHPSSPLIRRRPPPAVLLIPALLFAAGQAAAGEDHPPPEPGEHFRTQGAHEHGVARLNVAVEGPLLLLELETPLMNLVGFEHAPRDDAQRQALAAAESGLRASARLFRPTAEAACTPLEAQVEVHPGAPADADGEAHGDARGAYSFTCQRPEALNEVEVRLFSVFPGTERLRAQVVGRHGQRAQELTPDANRLDL